MSNLSKLLAKGGALARQGDITGARIVFERAANDHENNGEPWINLSAIHGMQGNFAEALRCARRAVELTPNSLQAWVNLANAARSCGEHERAAEAYQRARALPGCPPDVSLELGLTLSRLGRWAEAEQPLREHLSHRPGHREATLALGQALARLSQVEAAAAIREEYCRQQPGDVRALLELGATYFEAGRITDAWRVCEQATKQTPDGIDVQFFKAALLTFEGRLAEARDIYERLDRMHPGDVQILLELYAVCWGLSDEDACIAYAQAVLKLDPRNVTALLALSSALIPRDNAEAWKLLERAMAIAPDAPAVLVHKGELLEFKGDKLGAWECVQAAFDNGSTDILAARVAAAVAPTVGKIEEAVVRLERLVNRPEASFLERRLLHFALTSLCDKAKQYDLAFEHAVIANQMKKEHHNNNVHRVQVNRLKAVYSASATSSLPHSSNRSELPIFIVGMPRSGTSLLEQILSCHSKVHARGETTDIPRIVEAIPYYPDGARDLTPEKLSALADAHIRLISELAPKAIRITDKLPGNFLMLGIISQLFPGARILNCRRDPRDVCLSNFMTDYVTGHEYSYNLESLAQVCKSYQELMEHWKQVLPIPILDVRYEELVADPRAEVKKILDFCGLEWEEACLNFHQSTRQVMTASYDQVRQPMHKRSVARWKNYARHLEPVSRMLDLHDDSYP